MIDPSFEKALAVNKAHIHIEQSNHHWWYSDVPDQLHMNAIFGCSILVWSFLTCCWLIELHLSPSNFKAYPKLLPWEIHNWNNLVALKISMTENEGKSHHFWCLIKSNHTMSPEDDKEVTICEQILKKTDCGLSYEALLAFSIREAQSSWSASSFCKVSDKPVEKGSKQWNKLILFEPMHKSMVQTSRAVGFYPQRARADLAGV